MEKQLIERLSSLLIQIHVNRTDSYQVRTLVESGLRLIRDYEASKEREDCIKDESKID